MPRERHPKHYGASDAAPWWRFRHGTSEILCRLRLQLLQLRSRRSRFVGRRAALRFFSSERWIVGHSFAARWLTSVDCTDKHSHLWNDWPFLFRDDDISMSYIFTLQTFQELAIKNLDLFFQPKSFAVSYHGSCSISLSDSAFWETIRFPRFLHFIGDSI